MRLGIIGGTGSAGLFSGPPFGAAQPVPAEVVAAGPWGEASAPPQKIVHRGHEIFFLPRHGAVDAATIPPHRVNYRANVWAMAQLRVDHLLAINAVGGIVPAAAAGRLVLPDQLVDYTWGRDHTYTGDTRFPLRHVDFTTPFSAPLRQAIIASARRLGMDVMPTATYGVTQGPRLESAAEIDRLERDGCHVVGMTAMPEAGLARELDLTYAMCCVVVNQAAGRVPAGATIHSQMAASLAAGMTAVQRLITGLLEDAAKPG